MPQASLISPNDSWVLWTFLVGWAAFAIYSEQRWKIVAKLSGPLVALIGGMILANTGVIPLASPVYDAVWSYIVPLAIPLLLFKADPRRIWRETGRLFGAFHVSSLGTIIGGFIAAFTLASFLDYVPEITGIMTASYIGGAINFLACVNMFKVPESTTNALIVADNLVMVVHIVGLLALPGVVWAVRMFGNLPDKDLYLEGDADGTGDSNYWRPKPIALLNIAQNIALAFIIVTAANKLSAVIAGSALPEIARTILGNPFLLYSSLTVVFALLFPGISSRMVGTEELGTFAIYLFFVLIGIPASIKAILLQAPLLFVFCAIIVGVNVVVTFGLGKMFGYKLPELILVSVANIAGPMNSAGIAISKKWSKLVLPSFLVGVWGYVIGTYMGVFTREALRMMF